MSKTPFPPKLLEYPRPLQEKIDLVKHQQLIRGQTTFEGPLPYLAKQPSVTKPYLEPIQEATKMEASVS